MSLQKDEYYARYKSLQKEDLQLPTPDQNDDGDLIIETGELFCRIAGCANLHAFRQPYLLRKHVAKDHPEVSLARAPVGKPTQRSLDRAKAFYRQVVEAFDARKEQKKAEEETHQDEKAGAEPSAKRRRLE